MAAADIAGQRAAGKRKQRGGGSRAANSGERVENANELTLRGGSRSQVQARGRERRSGPQVMSSTRRLQQHSGASMAASTSPLLGRSVRQSTPWRGRRSRWAHTTDRNRSWRHPTARISSAPDRTQPRAPALAAEVGLAFPGLPSAPLLRRTEAQHQPEEGELFCVEEV